MFSSEEFWVKTPNWVPKIIKKAIWSIPSSEKVLYLTFDDGPTPVVTPWVLEQLKQYEAKATFFLIGERVEKYPETFQLLLGEQHQIGNHTYNHLNAWNTVNRVYYENVEMASRVLNSFVDNGSELKTSLLRPPYGKLKLAQYNYLKTRYKLVMWDVVPGDFLPKVDGEECFRRIKEYAKPGSIIVLHDNEKCFETIKVCLPKVLEHYSVLGYTFKAIESKVV